MNRCIVGGSRTAWVASRSGERQPTLTGPASTVQLPIGPGVLVRRRPSPPDEVRPRLIELTDAVDGASHWVTERAHEDGVEQRHGVFTAVCDHRVVAASLTAAPGRRCRACAFRAGDAHDAVAAGATRPRRRNTSGGPGWWARRSRPWRARLMESA